MAMEFQRQNSVQQKIGCVFEISIEDKASSKHQNQPFRVMASDKLNPELSEHDLEAAKATEKLDGTCCYISEFEGKPWLWARHDRKPNKVGEKKLKKYFSQKEAWRNGGEVGDRPTIMWDVMNDYKDVPGNWKPALEVTIKDGIPQPNEHGHIPGWVPVDPKGTQHKWHLTTVDLSQGLGLVLKQSDDGGLSVECVLLSDLLEKTVELIGTNVNANPYKLGTKQQPIHLLVIHGSITVQCPSPFAREALIRWLEQTKDGRVEGIVWHLPSGALFKLHRHHVSLPWPIDNPQLSQRKVRVCVDGFQFRQDGKCQFYLLSRHYGSTCDQLRQLHELMYNEPNRSSQPIENAEPSEPGQEEENRGWSTFKKVAPFVVGAVALPCAIPLALGAAGFGAGGIVAGSIAARAMSAAAIANGGGVAAGSAVAICQSIGAAGLGATGTAAASAVGAGLVGIGKGVKSLFSQQDR